MRLPASNFHITLNNGKNTDSAASETLTSLFINIRIRDAIQLRRKSNEGKMKKKMG